MHKHDLLGQHVRSARATRGWTQEELAARAGIDRQAIGRLERGATHAPSTTVVVAVARALNIPPSWLLATEALASDLNESGEP